MCGLAALIATQSSAQLGPTLAQMLALIRHRGPDDEGWTTFNTATNHIEVGGGADTPSSSFESMLDYAPQHTANPNHPAHLALGHRRLSIIDVSVSGHQPMSYGNQRYWIAFNGEIYNHIELKAKLIELNHQFVSSSDTEVILAAYAQWGSRCLEQLNGMFAFVLVDRLAKKIFIARDRFGIKPLYYHVSPAGLIAIGSEIKQFSALASWQPTLNTQRAYDFLAWGLLDHTNETMFAGVYQLPPGHYIELNLDGTLAATPNQKLVSTKWYQLTSKPFKGDLQAAADEFKRLFQKAVEKHLRADVALGSCLSGGLDSSAIVCTIQQLLAQNPNASAQHTFSACSAIKQFDEREYVEIVTNATKVSAHFVYPALNDLFKQLEQIVWHQDEPFGSTSIFAQWSVFEQAAQNKVKVLLDGQGADEQLAGYRGYFGIRFADLFRRLRWIKAFKEIQAAKKIHGYGFLWASQYIADALLPHTIRSFLRALVGKETAHPKWLNVALLGAHAHDPIKSKQRPLSVHELSYVQLTSSNLQMLLHWEDRDSMAHSVEARVPFLDHELVEFVLGLPDDFKIGQGTTKRVLREGLKGVLPEAIRTRVSKLGFATPEEHWVRHQAPEQFLAAITQAIETSKGVLHAESTLQLANDVISGARRFDFTLWRMISFSAWLTRFNVAIKPTP